MDMQQPTFPSYRAAIRAFSQQKIVVIGELILDVFLYGTANRICREAPVPVVNVGAREDVPGGAANAAVNLASMGAKTTLVSVLGKDRESQTMLALLRARGVHTGAILCDPARDTLAKQRVVSDDQLLVRYDYGSDDDLPADLEALLIDQLRASYADAHALLISDYACGLLTEGVIDAIRELRAANFKPLIVDSKAAARFSRLEPTAVKPNYSEAIKLMHLEEVPRGDRIEQILEHADALLKVTGASIVAVTVDSEGAAIIERGQPPFCTAGKNVTANKAVGAGDTYVSALTLGLSLDLPTPRAAELAAAAANIVVQKHSTATCTIDELLRVFTPTPKAIASREVLKTLVQVYRDQGKRIVFTNGCFDILHRGHVTFLAQAKALGDVLIVGVNSDASARRVKGTDRPINPLDDRMHVLAALDSVDHVISFDETTSNGLITVIQPDIFVKGGDHTRASLPEAPVVEAIGGAVVLLPYVVDQSTTAVIKRIRGKAASARRKVN
jgi:D-beta-D-heptose 7-phosphate kinase/D-beta-D-heptose 1-phosphate adenosyltransferase